MESLSDVEDFSPAPHPAPARNMAVSAMAALTVVVRLITGS
jgi:hypothetical protein